MAGKGHILQGSGGVLELIPSMTGGESVEVLAS